MSLSSLSPLAARTAKRDAILRELAPLNCWPRADLADHVCLAGVTERAETIFEVTRWPCRLAFVSAAHGSFVLSAPVRDAFELFAKFTSQSIPSLAGLAVTPLEGVDLEYGCYAIAWALGRWRTAKGAVIVNRGGGGGPRGIK